MCEQFPNIDSSSPSPAVGKAFMDALFPLVGEMVTDLFTPERIRELAAQLKAYRNTRYAAGDKYTATLANGAIVSLRDEQDPASSRFLYVLTYLSLMKGLESAADAGQE